MLGDKKVEEYCEKIKYRLKEINEHKGACMSMWNCGRLVGETNGLKMALDILNEVINTESEDK